MRKIFALLVSAVFVSNIQAQSTNYTLKVLPNPVLLEDNSKTLEKELTQATPIFGNGIYRIIQFYDTPNQAQKDALTNLGIQFFDYLPPHAYHAYIPTSVSANDLSGANIRSIQKAPKNIKIANQIHVGLDTKYFNNDGSADYIIMFQNNFFDQPYTEAVKNLGIEAKEINTTSIYVVAELSQNQLLELVTKDVVKFIDILPIPNKEDNHSRAMHRSSSINQYDPLSKKWDGTGVSVSVNDDGFVGPHIDFTGRTEQASVASDLVGDHGDMVAGILGGAGNLNPLNEGMAKGAFLWVRQYSSSLPGTVALHQNDSVMIFSSSYGDGCNAGYTALSQQVDQEIRQNESLIQVFSGGNSGTSNCSYGAGGGWGNITGGHKQGKNVIATANLDRDETLRFSSSRGPASDGRIKPDIAANGHDQISTDPNNQYAPGGGTSAAAPGISGILAQLYQAYRSFNGVNPESALLKASLLNSAEDFGNVGPDFMFGWGRVHAGRALDILENNQYLSGTISQGQNQTNVITVPSGVKEVRFMLYWRDYEGSPSSSVALVNDLDLTVDNGITNFLPWILDPTPNATNINLPATNGIDHLNNMEQVAIVDPASGTYDINVSGFDIPQGPQKYWIVYTFIYDDINVVYPNGGEGFVPGETERIFWDAYGTSGNFTLEYSDDNGTNWNLIASVSGSDRWYDWTVPNSVTGRARFRISRSGTQDISNAAFSIIEDPQNITVAQVCSSYVKIVWDPVPNAHSYKVFLLGNKYMDSVGYTNLTEFSIPTNVFTEHWISVAAYAPDDTTMIGRRAIAVYYDGSGILNCSQPQDLTVSNLVSPIQSGICDATGLTVTAEITNVGQNPLSNIDVKYQVSGQAVETTNFSGTLSSAGTTSITFPQLISLTTPGFYTLKVWVEHPSDLDPFNDTLTSVLDFGGSSITNYPYTQNFDSFNTCGVTTNCELEVCPLSNGWENLQNTVEDDIDWRVNDDDTPSSDTGPTSDHTGSNGNYIYLEASGGCTNEEAVLMSPCIDLTNSLTADLSFWYHMYGQDMGDLHVDIFDGTQWVNDVITPISGDQGNVWLNQQVNLTSYIGSIIKIRFRGITGSNWESDIALDDINLSHTSGVSTNDISSTYSLSVYPNPANNQVVINFDLKEDNASYISIVNIIGAEVLRVNTQQHKAIVTLDITDLAVGLYNVQLFTQNGKIVRPLIKKD